MQLPRVIKLLVFSDIICPWCYIGQREMDTAIEQCRDAPVQFEIEYRPYKLQPSLKEGESIAKREFFETRMGAARAEAILGNVSKRAQEIGIDIKLFEGVITQTTRAHRLLLKAWQLGRQNLQLPLLNTFFKIYFEEGQNIGDDNVLAKAAADSNVMSEAEALAFLNSSECLGEVEQMMVDVRRKGVTGVPFVVIDGKWAVSGGQSAETYVQIFNKISNTHADQPASPPQVPKAPTCEGVAA